MSLSLIYSETYLKADFQFRQYMADTSERGGDGGGGETEWGEISPKVADNGCNLHLKPRLYSELNTGPLVSLLMHGEHSTVWGLTMAKYLRALLFCFTQRLLYKCIS